MNSRSLQCQLSRHFWRSIVSVSGNKQKLVVRAIGCQKKCILSTHWRFCQPENAAKKNTWFHPPSPFPRNSCKRNSNGLCTVLQYSNFNFRCKFVIHSLLRNRPGSGSCDLSRLLARKITKGIHSCKPASLNCPIAYSDQAAGGSSVPLSACKQSRRRLLHCRIVWEQLQKHENSICCEMHGIVRHKWNMLTLLHGITDTLLPRMDRLAWCVARRSYLIW